MPYEKWFITGRRVDIPKAIRQFRGKVQEALNRGFRGARLTGSPSWMRNNLRAQSFREFEQRMDGQMAHQRAVAACTFPLRLAGG